jgi:hypothetical protein
MPVEQPTSNLKLPERLRTVAEEANYNSDEANGLMCEAAAEIQRLTRELAARQDLAYYAGARQAQGIAHQSLTALDKWIGEGCGGRWQHAKEALRAADEDKVMTASHLLACPCCASTSLSGPPRPGGADKVCNECGTQFGPEAV